ncbi:hypothetical protein RDI58_010014 [Solanum bulbocastanum]|uniref:Uncharacterized protein n=1 Tax=Solanum bulbocastanum TaxID=147425 RepID=A0AAN8YJ17_SOLBU
MLTNNCFVDSYIYIYI